MKIAIINGPNLNLTGTREPGIYGSETFEQLLPRLQKAFPETDLLYFQSNVEGELINKLHEVGFSFDGIILNPGGYTHTSVAIADAIGSIRAPVIEVHISNIFAREEYRHISITASRCIGTIGGLGMAGYELALRAFLSNR